MLFEGRRLWPVPGGLLERGILHPALLDGKSGPKVTQLKARDAAQEAGTPGLWCLPMFSCSALPPLAAVQPQGVGTPSAGDLPGRLYGCRDRQTVLWVGAASQASGRFGVTLQQANLRLSGRTSHLLSKLPL